MKNQNGSERREVKPDPVRNDRPLRAPPSTLTPVQNQRFFVTFLVLIPACSPYDLQLYEVLFTIVYKIPKMTIEKNNKKI